MMMRSCSHTDEIIFRRPENDLVGVQLPDDAEDDYWLSRQRQMRGGRDHDLSLMLWSRSEKK